MKAIKGIKVAVQKSHLIACEIFIDSINFEIFSPFYPVAETNHSTTLYENSTTVIERRNCSFYCHRDNI